MKKRYFWFLAFAAALILLLAVSASAEVYSGECGKEGDNLTWTLDENGLLTITGTGEMAGWTNISDAPWHSYISNIKRISIGSGVTSIGDYAFEDCASLEFITIPDSVTSIGNLAFYNCNKLTSITIPNSVTSIGDGAFAGCTGLTSITVDDGNAVYYGAGNCVIEKSTKTLIVGTKNSAIPSDGSVTSIGDGAFSGCDNLTSITIPNSVTSIGDDAFACCTDLTSITIPNSVTSIGNNAFAWCTSLTSITIPDSVTSIGEGTFCDCNKLASIIIPNSVTSIGNSAFCACSDLTSITIGNNVTSIGMWTFYNCNDIVSITIPNSVTSIGEYAFDHCDSLTSITFESPTTIIYNSKGAIDPGATIYGYNGSTAQAYAENYGRKFVSLDNAPRTETPLSGTVTVSGAQTPGSVLTASGNSLPSGATYSIQWYRNGTAISGATALTYTLTLDDIGATVTCVFTGTETYTGTLTSNGILCKVPDGLFEFDGKTYYVNNNHISVNLYVIIENYIYYFGSDGAMIKNETHDGYIFNVNGQMIGDKMTVTVNGKTYYLVNNQITVNVYGAPTYAWNNDRCTATRVSIYDASDKETETVTAKYVKDTAATATANEKGHYEVTFKNIAFTKQSTAKNSVEKPNTKLEQSLWWLWVLIALVVIGAGTAAVIVVKKRKKK